MGQVRQGLLRAQVLEVSQGEIGEWLRFTVESVLNGHEFGPEVSSHHEGVQPVVPDGAGVLSTNVDEHWTLFFVEVFVVGPDALIVVSVALEVEMVDWALHCALHEIRHVDLREFPFEIGEVKRQGTDGCRQ